MFFSMKSNILHADHDDDDDDDDDEYIDCHHDHDKVFYSHYCH